LSMNSGSPFLAEIARIVSIFKPLGKTSDSMSVTNPYLYSLFIKPGAILTHLSFQRQPINIYQLFITLINNIITFKDLYMIKHPALELPIRSKLDMLNDIVQIVCYL